MDAEAGDSDGAIVAYDVSQGNHVFKVQLLLDFGVDVEATPSNPLIRRDPTDPRQALMFAILNEAGKQYVCCSAGDVKYIF